MAISSRDDTLSLEGAVESLFAERVGECRGLPDGIPVVTENGGDDATEKDEPEEGRGAPMVHIMASREEEQFVKSGIYELEVTITLRVHANQLKKSQFSAAFAAVSESVDCAKSEEDGNSVVHVNSVENVTSTEMEYDDGVRSKALVFSVFATSYVGETPLYVTESFDEYYVPEDA